MFLFASIDINHMIAFICLYCLAYFSWKKNLHEWNTALNYEKYTIQKKKNCRNIPFFYDSCFNIAWNRWKLCTICIKLREKKSRSPLQNIIKLHKTRVCCCSLWWENNQLHNQKNAFFPLLKKKSGCNKGKRKKNHINVVIVTW
jgi:hypothetical protein